MKEVFVEAFARDPGNTYWWSPDTVAQAAWLRMRLERKMGDPDVRYLAAAVRFADGFGGWTH